MKNDESKEPEIITASQALKSYNTLVNFIEQNGLYGDEQINLLHALKVQLELSIETSKKQTNICDFLKKFWLIDYFIYFLLIMNYFYILNPN